MPRRHRGDKMTKLEKLQRQRGVGGVCRGLENEVRSSAIGLSRRRAWLDLGLGEKLEEVLPEPRGWALQLQQPSHEGLLRPRAPAPRRREPQGQQLQRQRGRQKCLFLSLPPALQSPATASHGLNLIRTSCQGSLGTDVFRASPRVAQPSGEGLGMDLSQ